jgi:hypothetical protein
VIFARYDLRAHSKIRPYFFVNPTENGRKLKREEGGLN